MTIIRVLGVLFGLATALLGGVMALAGIAVTIAFFPLGPLLGLPMSLLGAWLAGGGLGIAGFWVAAAGEES